MRLPMALPMALPLPLVIAPQTVVIQRPVRYARVAFMSEQASGLHARERH